jgi:hypothetical protein
VQSRAAATAIVPVPPLDENDETAADAEIWPWHLSLVGPTTVDDVLVHAATSVEMASAAAAEAVRCNVTAHGSEQFVCLLCVCSGSTLAPRTATGMTKTSRPEEDARAIRTTRQTA